MLHSTNVVKKKNLTSVAPIFSMTGILYPANRRQNMQTLRMALQVHGITRQYDYLKQLQRLFLFCHQNSIHFTSRKISCTNKAVAQHVGDVYT